MMTPLHNTRLLGAFAFFSLAAPLVGQEDSPFPFSTGKEHWSADSRGTLSAQDWPVEKALALTITFQEPEKKEPATDAEPEPEKPQSPAKKAAPKGSAKDEPKQLKFDSDRNFTMLISEEAGTGGGPRPIGMVQRGVKFDQERRAIRVVDIISSNLEDEREFSVSYRHQWTLGGVGQLAMPKPLRSSAEDKDAIGVMMMGRDSPNLPLLMTFYGTPRAGWKREQTHDKQHLSWRYQGRIPARGRVVLLHWIALREDASAETLEKTRASLIHKDGQPLDPSLNEALLSELINFPVSPQDDKAMPSVVTAKADLFLLKAYCETMKLPVVRAEDLLMLEAGIMLKGRLIAEEVVLTKNGEKRPLKLEQIAAIRGGGGTGRSHQIYFRNGTLATGEVSWKTAGFENGALGTIKLTPDSLDSVVLATTSDDGFQDVAPAGLLLEAAGGDLTVLPALPAKMARFRWAGGELIVPWTEVAALQQLPPPSLEHQVLLKDGTRLTAWMDPSASGLSQGTCHLFAQSWTDLANLAQGRKLDLKVEGSSLETSDSCLLSGRPGFEVLNLQTSAAPIELPIVKIRSISRIKKAEEGPPMLEVTTSAGAQFRGRSIEPTLLWKHASGTVLRLPWSLVHSIQLNEPAASAP